MIAQQLPAGAPPDVSAGVNPTPPTLGAPEMPPVSPTNPEAPLPPPDFLANAAAAPQTPQLGGSLLDKIGRGVSGFLGLSDNTPQAQTGAKIADLAGRLGEGLALSSGTPEQKELAETQLQMPLKIAELQSLMGYRAGNLYNKEQQNENQANRTTAEFGPGSPQAVRAQATAALVPPKTENLQADTAIKQQMLAGMIPVDAEMGALFNRPDLVGKTISPALLKALAPIAQVKGYQVKDLGYGGPQQGLWVVDRLGNPVHQVSPISATGERNKLTGERIQAMLQSGFSPVNDAQGNTIGWANPKIKQFVTPEQIQNGNIPGALTSALGDNVIPPKPTSSVLTMGQVGATLQPEIQRIQGEVQDLAGQIGPGAGRWEDFWVNKGGLNNPQYAALNTDLQLLATGIGRMHFGASIPEGFVNEMMKQFGTAQSPEDLQARIAAANLWASGYAASVGRGSKAVPQYIYAAAPDGSTHRALKGTALPQGWKLTNAPGK